MGGFHQYIDQSGSIKVTAAVPLIRVVAAFALARHIPETVEAAAGLPLV